MIRAGRLHLVRTLSDLAKAEGRSFASYKKNKLHRRPGHPEPISSPTARTLLYDGAQVDAFLAGEDIPALPEPGHPNDLLDQHEAAALVGLASRSWEVHKHASGLVEHLVVVRGLDPADDFRGVEHWPRHAILAWNEARPGTGHNRGGRPVNAQDIVPRAETLSRVADLLDHDPDVTAAQVEQRLGIHHDTASRILVSLRSHRVGQLLQKQPNLTPDQVADQLGYRLRNATNALTTARAQQRADAYAPYVTSVLSALQEAGIPVSERSGTTVRPGGICAAVAKFAPKAADAGIVWDERYGWRTEPQPQSSCGREPKPPTGEGIRYLAQGITPDADAVLAQLHDRRTGSRRPRLVRTEAELVAGAAEEGVTR
ncbi:DUF6292 family protein [Streptomyces justiciae]|uniref:DUF6292 family protein n=1 Tax=Streptomyces justiciae TaxID=2780140 RepID=UPI002117AA45|nr:DUF6292 family protein [Streptomyces justiciae]MCW8383970.1 DUF6292 family protein [Streptomyces justiciae]